ncbi:MAG: Eco57I restriction-modification methylase domain-containing protein [Phycisphaerales bacterium]
MARSAIAVNGGGVVREVAGVRGGMLDDASAWRGIGRALGDAVRGIGDGGEWGASRGLRDFETDALANGGDGARTRRAGGPEALPIDRRAWDVIVRVARVRGVQRGILDADGAGEGASDRALEELASLGGDGPGDDARLLSMCYEHALSWSGDRPEAGTGAGGAGARAGQRSAARHAAGAFSTPTGLIGHVLDQTLEPVLEGCACSAMGGDGREAIRSLLSVRVCDPAVGVGRFLIAAGWRIAGRVAAVPGWDGGERAAMRLVARSCLAGVDVDPWAVALCRLALWLECGEPGSRASDFAERVRVGDALLGAPRWLWEGDGVEGGGSDESARARADAWCERAAGAPVGGSVFHWGLEWGGEFRGGFDVVIGNPPFQNQLRGATARSRAMGALLRARTGGAVRRYADVAGAFVMLAMELARGDGGRVGMVFPAAMVSTGDAAGVRRAVCEGCRIDSIWMSEGAVFQGTGVRACAVSMTRREERGQGGAPVRVRRFVGDRFERIDDAVVDGDAMRGWETWGELVAPALGVPEVRIDTGGRGARTLGAIATATADFRDQYYGLRGFVVEDAAVGGSDRGDGRAWPRLVTSGLIGLGRCDWGVRSTRVHKARWQAPRVDADALRASGGLGAWLEARLVPKVLVATQTRVLHGVVDAAGEMLPSVPVITVVARDGEDPWLVLAAVCSPVCSAVALSRYPGAAMSGGAIKLSARQLMGLPLPGDVGAWMESAALLRDASAAGVDGAERASMLAAFGSDSIRAHGMRGEEARRLGEWWNARREGSRS